VRSVGVKFEFTQRFHHPVEDVERALLDTAFITEMATLPKLGTPEVLGRDVSGAIVTLRVRYAFVGEVSAAVRRVVDPARLTWVELSTTDTSTHRATFRIIPDNYGKLLRCEGTYELQAASPGAVRVARGEVRVNVPLVGSKVERVIVSGMDDHAQAEADLVEAWLGRH
jgi:Protein of unknown function (DUF2505)